MGKHRFMLVINNGKEGSRAMSYAYGSTKDIRLYLKEGRVVICFTQDAVHTVSGIAEGKDLLCADALKKAMLLHLIRYAKPLNIESLVMLTDGEPREVYNEKNAGRPLVYSMVENGFHHALPEAWQSDEVAMTILNTPKSAYDRRFNALNALLLAKSEMFRSKKSMYLWMAMNGLYAYMAEHANKFAPSKKKSIKHEKDEQRLLCRVIGLGNLCDKPSKDDEKDFINKAITMIARCTCTPKELYTSLSEGEVVGDLAQLKELLLSNNMQTDLLTFLTVWLPYQIRCNYFHSDAALPLFSFADEPLLKALGYTNTFVERFVEEQLPKLLKTKEMDPETEERIKEAFLSKNI